MLVPGIGSRIEPMSEWKRLVPKRVIQQDDGEWVQFEEVSASKTPSRLSFKIPFLALGLLAAGWGAFQVPEVPFQLGTMLYEGRFLPKNRPQAAGLLQSAAERGHAGAQFYMGYMHDVGDGVEQDFRQALVWYTRAARQGHLEAGFNLGFLYDRGLGVEEDDQQALLWYRRVAEKGGDAQAAVKVAELYAQGRGMPLNWAEARRWYQRAAEAGVAAGMVGLGRMLMEGNGVEPDMAAAKRWFEAAAAAGDAGGQQALGEWHWRQAKFREARPWFEKAAAQWHPDALAQLGAVYAQGKGELQNLRVAYMWYTLAAEAGHPRAPRALKLLESILSADQVAVVKAEAAQWRQRHGR